MVVRLHLIFSVVSLWQLAFAFPNNATFSNGPRKIGKRCTGTIESLADIPDAEECTTINIGGFTVPAGGTSLPLPSISMSGELTFAFEAWAGPLMVISGNDVTFNGNNHVLNGNGPSYWDGLGGNGGIQKPAPMIQLNMGGTFENVKIQNSPTRAVAVSGTGLTLTSITVDNSAGAAANSASGGKPAGANTDGFDVAANDVIIQDSTVINQDDCLAINRGTTIVFENNSCSGGHGISIGSISSDVTVSDVTISGNTVTNNVNGLRIKTDATATGSTVNGITFTNNKLSGITQFGVIIDQSYPSTLATPGTGVIVENVVFSGTNTISVASDAHRVEVNCGSTSSCPGTMDFSGLTVTGGLEGAIVHATLSGGSF
ncbi:uncharacterized protein STEHIDRAFT_159026 [Stereum hirsutum FP-91666 SS1]|uniref:uncharacterized protein n=1 Tax=Stereum hirsutum (strain FP-91666) TaxID=721885 RepID=UPI000444A0CF|nr:uncharacterized protein STEHIDRAFT_159026 [Stereum hirsutum FP-91666 SS1]EIM84346.1 hypothetical protein STEHIDRAFT_159026 [Stereum hirsutum FP-91666 SS1]